MNFELKSLALAGAASEKCDALVVLVSDSYKPAKDALADIIGQALKAGDFEAKAGKLLSLYKPAGVASARVLLVGAGDGSAKQTRQAVAAGVGALKGVKAKKLALVFADGGHAEGARAAVLGAAEASYVYTTTKSKPEPRSLQGVLVGVADAAAAKPLFERAVATVSGVELAKEWANRPANHATPQPPGQAPPRPSPRPAR